MVALVSFLFLLFCFLIFRHYYYYSSPSPFFFSFFFFNPFLPFYTLHSIGLWARLYLFDLCSVSYVQEDRIFMCLLFEKLTSVSCDNCLLCCPLPPPPPWSSDLMYRSYLVFCLLHCSISILPRLLYLGLV